mgnify:CR=1 FL=1|jgi:hypothetical protein
MDNEQINLYTKIEGELNSINPRKFKPETRKRYKRYCLKFVKVLIENKVKITSIRNIKNEHLKIYAKLMLALGRNIKIVVEELRGVVYWHTALNNGNAFFRYQHLMDLRILQNYLEKQEVTNK